MKNQIKITEAQLRDVIMESVKKVLKEEEVGMQNGNVKTMTNDLQTFTGTELLQSVNDALIRNGFCSDPDTFNKVWEGLSLQFDDEFDRRVIWDTLVYTLCDNPKTLGMIEMTLLITDVTAEYEGQGTDVHLTNFNIENVNRAMAALGLPEETVTLIFNTVNNWIGEHRNVVEESISEIESFKASIERRKQRSREEFGF